MVPSRTCAMLVLGFSLALAIVLSFPGELAFDGVVPAPTLRHSRAAHLPRAGFDPARPHYPGSWCRDRTETRSHLATSRLQNPLHLDHVAGAPRLDQHPRSWSVVMCGRKPPSAFPGRPQFLQRSNLPGSSRSFRIEDGCRSDLESGRRHRKGRRFQLDRLPAGHVE